MLICDTGPLLAAISRDDQDHRRCAELLTAADVVVVPILVVTELTHFLSKRFGVDEERGFLGAIVRGEVEVEPVRPSDWERIDELVGLYADLRLGTVDASVIAVCERLDETKLATLDRRHFSVVQPRHVSHLTLLPE